MRPLTPRELEVLTLLSYNHTTRGVARMFNLSPRTVAVHRQQILNKLNRHTMAAAVGLALREGIIE